MNFNKPKPRGTNMLQSSDKYNRSYYNSDKPKKKVPKKKSFTLATDSRSKSRKKKRKMRISNTARSFARDLKQLEGPSISNSENGGNKVKLKPWPIIHLADEQLIKLDFDNEKVDYETTEKTPEKSVEKSENRSCKWSRPRNSPREKRMKKSEYESSKLQSRRKERKMKKFDPSLDIDLQSISSDITSLKEDLCSTRMTRLEKMRRHKRKKKKKIIGSKLNKRRKEQELDLKKKELGKMDLESIDNTNVNFKQILRRVKQEEKREEMRQAKELERERIEQELIFAEQKKQREAERKRKIEEKRKREEEKRKLRRKMKQRSEKLDEALNNFDQDLKQKMFFYQAESAKSSNSDKKMCIEQACEQMTSEIKKVLESTGKKVEKQRRNYSGMKVKRNIWR